MAGVAGYFTAGIYSFVIGLKTLFRKSNKNNLIAYLSYLEKELKTIEENINKYRESLKEVNKKLEDYKTIIIDGTVAYDEEINDLLDDLESFVKRK